MQRLTVKKEYAGLRLQPRLAPAPRLDSRPVMHLKGLIFGMIFSSPFWAFLIYVMLRFQ